MAITSRCADSIGMTGCQFRQLDPRPCISRMGFPSPRRTKLISTSLLLTCCSQRRGGCLGDGLILVGVAAADPDRAHDLTVACQWDTAGEDHHPAVVAGVDAEQRTA